MGKGKKNKRLIAFVLLLIFGIIIAIGFYQGQLQLLQPKKPAEEYFELFDYGPDNCQLLNNGSSLMIYEIHFWIKAVGGDAHSVIAKSWANAQPEYVGDIEANQLKFVSQASPSFGYISHRNSDGMYPFPVKLTSREAEGTITIYF